MPLLPVGEANGWKLFAHNAFSEPLNRLILEVEDLQLQSGKHLSHPKAKLLKRVLDLMMVEIPCDPNAAEFQLGNTLGTPFRHWRRAKFLSRFRLFFRFSSTHRAIVYGWVNDENTLRKAGAHTDPYAIFLRRLQAGDPPDDWDDLLREARASTRNTEASLRRRSRK